MVKVKKRKSAKMTVKEEIDTGTCPTAEADRDQGVVEMEIDEEPKMVSSSDLLQILEDSSSALKLIKHLFQNSKEICKLLTASPNGALLSHQIFEKIVKTCEKHKKSEEKTLKFLDKISEDEGFSCDSDLFKTLLKYGMNSGENSESGPRIIGILQAIFSVGAQVGRIDNATLGIQMIVSHSKAADIFLESHQLIQNNAVKNASKTNTSQKPEKVTKPHDESQDVQQLEKFSDIKTQLLKLWKNLVINFTKVSKTSGTPNDKKILENSVPYLFQMYSGTMGEADQEIFQILQQYTGKRLQISVESLPLFGPKSLEPVSNSKASNPLFAHSSRANTILGLINERQAFQTAMNYNGTDSTAVNSKHYDFRFLLPLICHVLDAKNICDAVKVVSHGWIYLIVRGMSFEDPVMRNLAFLAYKLLIQNFQLPKKGYKMQDIKVWLHFLLSVRKGLQSLGKCKVSNLLSMWMVAAWECVRQPAHPLYPRLTNLLLAKPVIDLSVLPDFMPFYNATNGNRVTREWMLNILSRGLQTKEDWQVAQRLPTINSLCCSFLVENIFTQREILRILCEGAKVPEIAQEMVDKHSLLVWISNVPLHSKLLYRRELRNLFETLRENCVQNESRHFLFRFVENSHGWDTNETES